MSSMFNIPSSTEDVFYFTPKFGTDNTKFQTWVKPRRKCLVTIIAIGAGGGDIASRVLVWYARDGGRLFNYKHTWVALQREALASTKRMDKGTGHH